MGNAKVGAVSKGEIIVDDELACELSAHLAEHGLADLIEVFRLLAAWKDDEMKKLGSQQ
ncbi:MAG: hypothetical protein Q8O67_17150 [Deltaproteobacteria bacterium]|nr:hypothetical protein [Deltaproteobacteria bacterium]